MTESTKYWLWLTLAYGPANSRKWNFLSHYSSVREAYDHVSSGDFTNVLPQDKRPMELATPQKVEELISECEKNRITIYSYDDPEFPDRLREIYNPPSVIFTLGRLDAIDETVIITSVGTRKPDDYSRAIASRLIRELAQAGVTIASGCASGLDSVSLVSAIKGGGKVYTVMPCGLLSDYPKNSASMKKAVAAHGAVISEYLPHSGTTSLNFRLRNRILSAIGLGTLILQAGATSGSLSTANFALSQGKDIFCIPPHNLYDDSYSGVILLLRDGAIPVFDSRDILNEYYSVYAHRLNYGADIFSQRSESGLFGKNRKVDSESEPEKVIRKKPRPEPKEEEMAEQPIEPRPAPDLSGLSDGRRKIVEFILSHGVVLFDEIAENIDGTVDLETALTELELDGIIRSLSGNRYTV
ncbi:MAG: DNA-protecting protein DprA [Oscillospiraceae bacterium]|nr:DNA-protecting protein DprA [Oscillospiraceae bacterium]